MKFSRNHILFRILILLFLSVCFYNANAQRAKKDSDTDKKASSLLGEIADSINTADKAPAKDLNLSIPGSSSFQDIVNGKMPAPAVPAGTTKPSSDFDLHLLMLINSLKDNFKSIRGLPVAGKQAFTSKVSLDGALTTEVNYSMMMDLTLVADFGEFNSMEEALPVYKKVAALVGNAKNMPASMVEQKEIVSEISRTIVWIPFGDVDPGIKGFTVVLEAVKTYKFDAGKRSEVYSVLLKIKK